MTKSLIFIKSSRNFQTRESTSSILKGHNMPLFGLRKKTVQLSDWSHVVSAAEAEIANTQLTKRKELEATTSNYREWMWPLLVTRCEQIGINPPINPIFEFSYGGGYGDEGLTPFPSFTWIDRGVTFRATTKYQEVVIGVVFDTKNGGSRHITINSLGELGNAIKEIMASGRR